MASGTPLAAIGVKIGYMTGTSNTTPVPSTGYSASTHFTRLYDLKSTADFNPSPNTADATTFDNTEYTTYVDLLKDLGGALEFSANLTDAFKTAWATCVDAYEDAQDDGNYMWFVIDIPGINDSVYFVGKPSKMGLPALSANSLMETTVYITPNGEPRWITDPTSNYTIWGEQITSAS